MQGSRRDFSAAEGYTSTTKLLEWPGYQQRHMHAMPLNDTFEVERFCLSPSLMIPACCCVCVSASAHALLHPLRSSPLQVGVAASPSVPVLALPTLAPAKLSQLPHIGVM